MLHRIPGCIRVSSRGNIAKRCQVQVRSSSDTVSMISRTCECVHPPCFIASDTFRLHRLGRVLECVFCRLVLAAVGFSVTLRLQRPPHGVLDDSREKPGLLGSNRPRQGEVPLFFQLSFAATHLHACHLGCKKMCVFHAFCFLSLLNYE